MESYFVRRMSSIKFYGGVVLCLLFIESCLIVVQLHAAVSPVTDVKLAFLIYRHGDRTPLHTYPGDSYANNKSKLWQMGFGELTTLGIEQQYQLGKFFRQRYSKLLSPDFNDKEVKIISTGYSRTLQSAQASNAGFFPPVDNDAKWNASGGGSLGASWRPVPIESDSANIQAGDYLFSPQHCPRLEVLFDHVLNDPNESSDLYKTYKEGLPIWERLALPAYHRENTKTPLNISEILWLRDTLFVDMLHNQTWNSTWMNKVEFDAMSNVTRQNWLAFGDTSDEMALLTGGRLLYFIEQAMAQRVEADKNNVSMFGGSETLMNDHKKRKMFVFSGHDSTIAGVAAALKVHKQVDGDIPYTSTLLIELLQDDTVRVLYKNDLNNIADGEPRELDMTTACEIGHMDKCRVDDLIKSTLHRVTPNLMVACGGVWGSAPTHFVAAHGNGGGSGVMLAFVILLLIIIGVGGVLSFRRFQRHKRDRREMQELVWADDEL